MHLTFFFPFQVILLLFLMECHPHPQVSHDIYSESDLLAVDTESHSYSVSVAAPQEFIDQLAMDSHVAYKQVILPILPTQQVILPILPTPLPGVGPRQQAGPAGKYGLTFLHIWLSK